VADMLDYVRMQGGRVHGGPAMHGAEPGLMSDDELRQVGIRPGDPVHGIQMRAYGPAEAVEAEREFFDAAYQRRQELLAEMSASGLQLSMSQGAFVDEVPRS
jgi:hypothetical protein